MFCDIHSHMSAYILVFSHRFFAITDDDDRFVIPNVPSGNYTLNVWSESGHADARRITVQDGAVTEAGFLITRAP